MSAPGVLTLAKPPRRELSPSTLLSVVIPCFNEEAVLPLLHERLQHTAEDWGVDYEIILVDDGSSDATWEFIEELHRRDPRYVGVRLSRNFGHQSAVWAGLSRARGEVIAVIDADLQDPPEVIGELLVRWADGDDVVYAVRRKRKESWPKRLAYHLFYRVLGWLSDTHVPHDSGDFCLIDRRVLRAMLISRERFPFVRGLRAWVGFRQSAHEYERNSRAGGEPKYTFRKLVRLAVDGVISCSTRPLRLATWMGVTVSMLAFLGVGFTLLQRLFAEQFAKVGLAPVPGYATIVICSLFLGGVQLLCLGILGEYVGRIFHNVQGRPQVIVSEICGEVEEPDERKKRRKRKRTASPTVG